MKVKEGDIVFVDESLVYGSLGRKFKALVLWNGVNMQPLLTELGEYNPFWSTYKAITEVIGHINMRQFVPDEVGV